jgi:Ca2+-binding EF-hand superfamily protein
LLRKSRFVGTKIGDRLFNVFKILNPNPEATFMTTDPFLKLMAILYKGTLEEKCELFYTFFDQDGDNFVTRDEMITCFSEFFEAFKSFRVDGARLNELRESVDEASELEINQCILDNVSEIFNEYAKREENLIHREEVQAYLYDAITQFN